MQKALCPTRFFRRRKNMSTRCARPSRHGRRRMAFLPCHKQIFQTYVTTCGLNTPNRSPTTSQSPLSTNFNPHLMGPSSTVRTNMPLRFVSTVHVSITNPLRVPFKIHPFSNNCQTNHLPWCPHWSIPSIANMAKAYPWAVGSGRQLPSGYILAKRKKDFRSGRPIISFVDSPFRPMLNILARLIFQLIPSACPHHFATGDVYTLLSILREAPVDADLILVNQDLAGFFTSIDQDRFVRSWFMLLDFLRPKMNVSDDEAFSVYPGNPTIQVTSSKDAHFVVSMSLGRLSSNTFLT